MKGEKAALKLERCIGCGLCVSTCPAEALMLVRKPEGQQPNIPNNQRDLYTLRLELRALEKAELANKFERHRKS